MNSNLEKLISSEEKDFFHTYKRLKINITRGEGCYLFTDDGRKILDMFGGLAVNVLGYSHPAIINAIESQIKKYIHVSNYFYEENQITLANLLVNASGMKKVFFSNSGTEAIEAAIKLTRKYFKGSSKKELISFTGSFHGRTLGALSLTARPQYKEDYGPLLTNVKTLKFNSVDELQNNVSDSTAAVFVECIQGEGGINIASAEFVKELIELRNKFGFLLIADEIQSGVGRTGKFCGYEQFSLVPDVVVMAKGIGGGLPLGAMLGSERVESVFSYGDHGSTFGGNPVAAACGISIMNELNSGIMGNAASTGKYILDKLEIIKMEIPGKIKEVRGMGLMIGIELNFEGYDVMQKMMAENVFVNCTNLNVIRLLPPLTLTVEEADIFLDTLRRVIKSV